MRRRSAIAAVGVFLLCLPTPLFGGADTNDGSGKSGTGGPSVRVELEKDLDLEFVRAPAGSFIMGSDSGRIEHDEMRLGYGPPYDTGLVKFNYRPEAPAHRVTFENGFLIGKYEVTNAQWEAVMKGVKCNWPMKLRGGPRAAVSPVAWSDAQLFVRRLNERIPGQGFSLPTEEQWEYACRAGSTTKYSFGDDPALLDEYAWRLDSNEPRKPVGIKKPNAWGIYDMHGNASEWCLNAYTLYPGNPVRDMWLELFHNLGRAENEFLGQRGRRGDEYVERRVRETEFGLFRTVRGGPNAARKGTREPLEDTYASARRGPELSNVPRPDSGFRLVCHGFVELPAWRGVVSGTLPESTPGAQKK